MSVELLDSPRFHGYRVRRQIGGKTYQEYFPLKKDGRRLNGASRAAVKQQAETRDEELEGMQAATRDKAARQIHIAEDGQVKGILCRLKAEKSGSHTPVFQIGVSSQLSGKIVNTTVSINKFGTHEAWRRAVEFYVHHKQISKRSRAYRQLLEAEPTPVEVKRMTGHRVTR